MESLELFAREVMPEFKERDERRVAEKQNRLAPAIEAAMARRVNDVPPMPEGYTITPMVRKLIQQHVGEAAIEQLQQAQATGTMQSVMQMFSSRPPPKKS
jgi:hypothetical protein